MWTICRHYNPFNLWPWVSAWTKDLDGKNTWRLICLCKIFHSYKNYISKNRNSTDWTWTVRQESGSWIRNTLGSKETPTLLTIQINVRNPLLSSRTKPRICPPRWSGNPKPDDAKSHIYLPLWFPCAHVGHDLRSIGQRAPARAQETRTRPCVCVFVCASAWVC